MSKLRFALLLLPLSVFAAIPLVKDESQKKPDVLDGLREATVMIASEGGNRGTGVVVKREGYALVWTAAHVLYTDQLIKTAIDPETGQEKVFVTYRDVRVVKEVYHEGRKVGETFRFAEIIRFSKEEDGGDDLALLMLRDPEFVPHGVTFTDDVSKPSTALWHVGCPGGTRGAGNVFEGLFSVAGRLRGPVDAPVVMDAVSITTIPGSSGGGVFLKSDGRCIGLLTERLYAGAETSGLVIPTRRMKEFARRTSCLWALEEASVPPEELRKHTTDKSVPTPTKAELIAPPKGGGM
jgi:hypothetical protein